MIRSCSAALSFLALLFIAGCQSHDPLTLDLRVNITGVSEPVVFYPHEVELPGEVLVIGVVVGDQPRAYVVEALSLPMGHTFEPDVEDARLNQIGRHVVNDFLNGVPITVTHCDINECSKVFTADRDEALQVDIAGFGDNSLLLSSDAEVFAQSGEEGPLEVYAFELTTWAEWLAAFPQTDVYVGHLAEFVVIGYGHSRT